ncbi:MAG TPA: hypothetical protein VHW23_39645 [Kofleriaceae bacterium]|nr:hypothetical protein [Kofleriaceae bacterium]
MTRSLVLGAACLLASQAARAEPDDLVARPLTLEAGELDLRLTASINSDQAATGRPVSLAPDAWFGIAPRWTVGIIHSDQSLDQIATSGSFCIRDSQFGACQHLYQGSGIDVRFGALEGDLAIAPRVRAVVRDIEPFKPAVTLGATVRWTQGRFAIASDPYLRLPLANHELGNRAAIALPLWFAVQPAPGWMIGFRTGFASDLVVLGDGGHVPVAFDVSTRITEDVDGGLEAGWGSLLGPQQEVRTVTVMVMVGWRYRPRRARVITSGRGA